MPDWIYTFAPTLSIYRMPHLELISLLRTAFGRVHLKIKLAEAKWASQIKTLKRRQRSAVPEPQQTPIAPPQTGIEPPQTEIEPPQTVPPVNQDERDAVWNEAEAELQMLYTKGGGKGTLNEITQRSWEESEKDASQAIPTPPSFSSASTSYPTGRSTPLPRIQVSRIPRSLRPCVDPTSNSTFDESSIFAGESRDDDILIDHPSMQLDSARKVCSYCNYFCLSTFC